MPHLSAIVVALVDTGRCWGDLTRLTWGPVEFDQGLIAIVAAHEDARSSESPIGFGSELERFAQSKRPDGLVRVSERDPARGAEELTSGATQRSGESNKRGGALLSLAAKETLNAEKSQDRRGSRR
jgi:hypothetical protein